MPSPEEELHSITQILHLTNHRNKNQHRLARWWKSFSMLRRHLQKLLAELNTNIQYTALSAKSKKTVRSREIVEMRAAFLEDVLIERCYVAFGNLVADNQYAALGLMLVGTLARVRRVVKGLRGEQRVEEGGDKRVDDRSLRGTEVKDELDLGQVVRREELVEGNGPAKVVIEDVDNASALKRSKTKKRSVATEEATVSTVDDSIASKRPKKKRKKGDAFDDLFASLV